MNEVISNTFLIIAGTLLYAHTDQSLLASCYVGWGLGSLIDLIIKEFRNEP